VLRGGDHVFALDAADLSGCGLPVQIRVLGVGFWFPPPQRCAQNIERRCQRDVVS
jgi:hypothetical protein